MCRDDMGAAYVSGTSFAAPWISRKLAYLIHIMGLSREVAKALLMLLRDGIGKMIFPIALVMVLFQNILVIL